MGRHARHTSTWPTWGGQCHLCTLGMQVEARSSCTISNSLNINSTNTTPLCSSETLLTRIRRYASGRCSELRRNQPTLQSKSPGVRSRYPRLGPSYYRHDQIISSRNYIHGISRTHRRTTPLSQLFLPAYCIPFLRSIKGYATFDPTTEALHCDKPGA